MTASLSLKGVREGEVIPIGITHPGRGWGVTGGEGRGRGGAILMGEEDGGCQDD